MKHYLLEIRVFPAPAHNCSYKAAPHQFSCSNIGTSWIHSTQGVHIIWRDFFTQKIDMNIESTCICPKEELLRKPELWLLNKILSDTSRAFSRITATCQTAEKRTPNYFPSSQPERTGC